MQIWVEDQVAGIDLYYPRGDETITTIEVGMTDVRATDSLRIKYDFPRNGWAVYQPKTETVRTADPSVWRDVDEWIEVAFLPSWRFREEDDE